MSECLRQVLFLMRLGQPEVTFEDRLPATKVIAEIDHRLLSQALTNIVKNAAEGIAAAREADPGLARRTYYRRARTDPANDVATVDVIDNGKGFPRENRQRLLEPYMTTRAEGTGLGLPIVAKILEDHGGGIELFDAPEGQGARVRLTLRLNPAALPTERAAPTPTAEVHS